MRGGQCKSFIFVGHEVLKTATFTAILLAEPSSSIAVHFHPEYHVEPKSRPDHQLKTANGSHFNVVILMLLFVSHAANNQEMLNSLPCS